MKSCEICKEDRIAIGGGYAQVSPFRRAVGVTLIYAPIVLFPFAIAIALITRLSLAVLGAKNVKSYWDFVPARNTHRYKFAEQIVMDPPKRLPHLGWKIFWQFNCTWYCPMSVALFDYLTYLVKAVENWWCPFFHERKADYTSAPLDKSYWHAKEWEAGKLHPEDYDNPIWNAESPLIQISSMKGNIKGES